MSREQRRADRKQQTRADASSPSRRTPVKVAGGSRFPAVTMGIVGGVLVVVAVLVYLIYQSSTAGPAVDAAKLAEEDSSASIPGTFYPTQGKDHFSGEVIGHTMTPFCPGVLTSESAKRTIIGGGGTPAESGTSTSTSTSTPAPSATPSPNGTVTAAGTANTTPTVQTGCYASNPPSSGKHLGVLRKSDIGGGTIINIPPDPDVYPDDLEIPRDAIAHILEHSGLFVGWNCASGDSACADAVQKLKKLVNGRIDNNDDRIVMAHDTDLPEGTFGFASWTRAMMINASDWENQKGAALKFISTNSCRFNPEGFCK